MIMAWLLDFPRRDREWSWQFLLWADTGLGLVISFFTFLLFGRGRVWSADESISSRVGRNALLGARWARLAQVVIDRIFEPYEEHHCLRAIELDELDPLLRLRIERLQQEELAKWQ